MFETAYLLASAVRETNLGTGMTETGPHSYFDMYEPGTAKGKELGNTEKGDGYTFRGRGYIQVTGRKHYQEWKDSLGIDFIGDPSLMTDPATAAYIAVHGIQDGAFTGKKLSQYINYQKTDFFNARRAVNGLDHADEVAHNADLFLGILSRGCSE